MSAVQTQPGNPGALFFYIVAAIIVAGLVLGTLVYGLLGLTVWMIALTFAIFVVLIGISVS